MRALAIFGGTFDPIHLGHLCVVWEASELLDAPVLMMPSGMPPHRPPPIASAPQRLAMLQVALRGQSRLSLDARELVRSGPSYTVDTLVELRAEHGDRPLVLLLGADAFAGLPGWHGWRGLFELVHIGVLSRPGEQASLPDELQQEIGNRWVANPAALQSVPAGRLVALSVTSLEISATRIRELLAAGREPRYQLPAGLFDQPELLAPYRLPAPK
ncbi:MAG: nicotinate-nucleotide adenylyltransferase [Rhodanobacter sp.]|nr:MAG: nicotinate-nucleotide adenylyltransferase [Rhodanobacter sp.]TAM38382.1 MAG: nicotinate-nucleotide adenylyltransferase [Rhodanobacter sp.]TAN27869.1 MAG: nicotinate-nucleotide adenylyltransferase [Rhodanobacter sp.]